MKYYSAIKRNAFESVLMRGMNLEPIIQSEVSQKKKDKYPLDCKEIQLVHSEGDQAWNFFGGNDAEAETPVLWPPHGNS